MRASTVTFALLATLLSACGEDPPSAGADAATGGDLGRVGDAAPSPDVAPVDPPDATPSSDAEHPDAGEDGGVATGDAGAEEAGPSDADPGEDGGPDGGACVAETDVELCAAAGFECDAIEVIDRCGVTRRPSCGTCTYPATCGGRGARGLCVVEHWDVTTIDAAGDVGREVSLALGLDGYPRVSYQALTAAGQELRVARFDGTSWLVELLDDGPLAATHTAITRGPDGTIMVAATSLEGLVVWTSTTTGWTRELVTPGARGRLDLTFDPLGAAHLCIHNESLANLEHWSKVEGAWEVLQIEGSVAPQARQGDHCSITSASDGTLWVSYEDQQFLRLAFAYNAGAGWVKGVADAPTGETAGTYTAIAIDSTDSPGISYRAGSINFREIRLARYGDPTWSITTVDPLAGTIANYTTLAFDHADFAHVGSFDSSRGGVMEYAFELVGGWVYEDIEVAGTGTGGHSAMELDATDSAHIAFYNSVTQSLRYARYVP